MADTADFQELCRVNGWKCTPQRLAVYQFIHGNLNHPAVDEVWEAVRQQVPSITRESVYRILNEFAGAGEVRRLDRIGSARYDAQCGPHGHLVCEKCLRITDFPLKQLPDLPPEVAKAEINHIEVRLFWVCPECRKKQR